VRISSGSLRAGRSSYGLTRPIQTSLVDVKLWVKQLRDVLSVGIVEPISLLQHWFDSPTGFDRMPSFLQVDFGGVGLAA